MKINLTKIFLLFIIVISITSCENSFSPLVNFKQQYALNCIIRGDTSLQYATITRSFGSENFNGKSSFVSGAQLKLNYDGTDYLFSDTATGGTDNIPFYYLKNFNLEYGKHLSIEADLPDGTVLTASTNSPDPGIVIFGGDKTIPNEITPNVISINWRLVTYSGESLYFKPFLYIEYKKDVNGTTVYLQKEVPLQYNMVNNKLEPVYPKISTDNSIQYSSDAFNTTLNDLKRTDTLSNSNILNAKFVLWVFDRNLAAYLLSAESFKEGFSLRIEASEFTNVQGGLGIFGSFLKYETNIQLKSPFLKSLKQ